MGLKHSKTCQERMDAIAAAIAAYDAKWPAACKKCGGVGEQTERYDPSPAGVHMGGGGYMEDTGPCPECFEEGKCPRCASELTSAEDFEWSKCDCGWCWTTEDGPVDDKGKKIEPRPEEDECGCGVVYMRLTSNIYDWEE